MEPPRFFSGFEVGSACDAGRQRTGENQDRVEVILPRESDVFPPLLLVADGMGGHLGGALASRLVVETFKENYLQAKHPTELLGLLHACAARAHQSVRERGASNHELAGMGSTLVAVALTQRRAFVLNVGDSRAYVLHGDRAIQISQDQSEAADLVRAGLLTAEQARGHPKRNRLNMSITAKRAEIQPYAIDYPLEADDILLLCSDGLWGVVPETLMCATASELSPQPAADKLVALANASQGPDNISVVVARRFDKDPKRAQLLSQNETA
jgi:protein phosphatase